MAQDKNSIDEKITIEEACTFSPVTCRFLFSFLLFVTSTVGVYSSETNPENLSIVNTVFSGLASCFHMIYCAKWAVKGSRLRRIESNLIDNEISLLENSSSCIFTFNVTNTVATTISLAVFAANIYSITVTQNDPESDKFVDICYGNLAASILLLTFSMCNIFIAANLDDNYTRAKKQTQLLPKC